MPPASNQNLLQHLLKPKMLTQKHLHPMKMSPLVRLEDVKTRFASGKNINYMILDHEQKLNRTQRYVMSLVPPSNGLVLLNRLILDSRHSNQLLKPLRRQRMALVDRLLGEGD